MFSRIQRFDEYFAGEKAVAQLVDALTGSLELITGHDPVHSCGSTFHLGSQALAIMRYDRRPQTCMIEFDTGCQYGRDS